MRSCKIGDDDADQHDDTRVDPAHLDCLGQVLRRWAGLRGYSGNCHQASRRIAAACDGHYHAAMPAPVLVCPICRSALKATPHGSDAS